MSMRRRVLTAIMLVTTTVVLLFAVPLGFLLDRFLDERAIFSLEHRVDVAARNIDLTNPTDLPDASEFPVGPDRFALYNPTGWLVTGTGPATLPPTAQRSTVEEGPNLVTTLPVMSGETLLGFVRAERSLKEIDAITKRALGLLVAGAIAVLGIGWFIALRLARTIATSTESLRLSAIRLGSGDFMTVAPATGIRELDDVGDAMTATAYQLGQLVDREHAFSADVSHQLRTPVAGLRAALETELAFPRGDRLIIVHESLADVERFEQTITDILSFARTEQRAQETTVDVTELVRTLHHDSLARFTSADRTLTLTAATTPVLAVGNAHLLRQALDALVDNAFAHGDGATELGFANDDSTVTIFLTNFAARDPHLAGSDAPGLGLALANRLIRAQGGRLVTALSDPKSTVRVVLVRR